MFMTSKTKIALTAAALSASLLVSGTSFAAPSQSFAGAPASAANDLSNLTKANQSVDVSRSEARRIVNNYLKKEGKKNLRAGKTTATDNYWVVEIKSPSGLVAGTMKVNRVSGELSKS